MQQFKPFIIDLANKYGLRPVDIQAMEMAYDFIGSFAFVETEAQLNQCVMEIRDGKNYIYRDVPNAVKTTVAKHLKKYGPNGLVNFFSPMMKEDKFEFFVQSMIKERMQPSAMIEDGIITYKNLKQPNSVDHCVTVSIYSAA